MAEPLTGGVSENVSGGGASGVTLTGGVDQTDIVGGIEDDFGDDTIGDPETPCPLLKPEIPLAALAGAIANNVLYGGASKTSPPPPPTSPPPLQGGATETNPQFTPEIPEPAEKKGGKASGGTSKPDPCAGKGLDTTAKVAAYDKALKQLEKDWSKLSPAQRQQRLGDAARAALGSMSSGLTVAGSAAKAPGNAEYEFGNNQLVVSSQSLNQKSITDAQMKTLADDAYHELRHAEQWYAMARRSAGDGKNSTQIQNELGVPKSIADEAVKAPIKPGDPDRPCADVMYNSVYGPGATSRNTILTNLTTLENASKAADAALAKAAAADDAAQKAYQAMAAAKPPASPAALAKAFATWQKAYADWKAKDAAATAAHNAENANYKAYRALPEEKDAWRVGNRVSNSW